MNRSMASTVAVIILFLLGLNALMYLRQPGMIFFPFRTLAATPANWGLTYEDVALTTADGIALHGWFIPRQGARYTLLFFHGNAGNISHRGDSIDIFHRLGLNVFIVDYRGYGQSQGSPTERGFYKDARAAWQYLVQTRGVSKDNIIIFGRSLGGVVATHLAADVQPRALILESTFSSARDFAAAVFPVLSRLIFVRFRFDVAQLIKHVTCPLLVVHSPEDEIIPFHLGQKVYQAANAPKTSLEIHGDHNYGFLHSQPAYERSLDMFIK